MIRPQTSPTPYSVPHNSHGAAAGHAAHAPPIPRGPSAGRSAHLTYSKLRPLPLRGGNAGVLSMMIEGTKTGEEKTISGIDRRESIPRMVASATAAESHTATGNTSVGSSGKDALRLKKYEQDLRRLQDLLRKRTGERDDEGRKAGSLQEMLDATVQKLAMRERDHDAQMQTRQTQAAALEGTLKDLQAQLATAKTGAIAADEAARAAEARRQKDAAAQADQLRAELAEKAALCTRLAADLDSQRKVSAAASAQKDHATSAASGRIEELERLLREKTAECERWKGDAMAAQGKLREQEALLSTWRTQVEATNAYVVRICQPQFSVVKDESMAPVPPGAGSDGQEGFVLVPLRLMLEGYTLLPQDMKKKIAAEYEANKRDLASALPRRVSVSNLGAARTQ